MGAAMARRRAGLRPWLGAGCRRSLRSVPTGSAWRTSAILRSFSAIGISKTDGQRKPETLFELGGHARAPVLASFSPDGRTIATGGADGITTLCDGATGHAVERFRGHHGPVQTLAFSDDGLRFPTPATRSHTASGKKVHRTLIREPPEWKSYLSLVLTTPCLQGMEWEARHVIVGGLST